MDYIIMRDCFVIEGVFDSSERDEALARLRYLQKTHPGYQFRLSKTKVTPEALLRYQREIVERY